MNVNVSPALNKGINFGAFSPVVSRKSLGFLNQMPSKFPHVQGGNSNRFVVGSQIGENLSRRISSQGMMQPQSFAGLEQAANNDTADWKSGIDHFPKPDMFSNNNMTSNF